MPPCALMIIVNTSEMMADAVVEANWESSGQR